MTNDCKTCPVSTGTHKPAEAVHVQIDEPQDEAMRLADECDESATHWVHEIDTRLKAAKMLRAQHARIAELESQLDAIGAGGVEPLRKPAAPQAVQAAVPLFWVRLLRDGLYEGPVHNNSVGGKMLRDEKPGEWHPLYLHTAPAHPAEGVPAQSYVADFFREKGFYPSLAQAFAAGVAHAAAMPAQSVDEIMELADEYAGAQACAVTATSTEDADTTKERNALLSAIRAALAATQPAAQGMEKDAARYRWLRATTNTVTNSDGGRIDVRNQPDSWDAAIDAALAAQAKQGGAA